MLAAGRPDRRDQGRAAGRAAHGAGEPPRHHARPRADLPGPGQVRARPHRGRPRGQARPGHRARRGDPPGDPGAVPAHQEQPRADRRARRRQDGHRRGAGQPHHRGRRARGAEGQARRRAGPRLHGGRRQVPRRVRGAPEGGAQGDHRRRGRDRHLHRRAAHDRRGRRGRGGHGRRADDQAHAGPGRAAPHRGHDARRVPQVDREGRRAGAPVPARLRGGAVGGGHHRHPARAVRALHGAPQGAHSGRRAGGGRRAVGPLRHGALPARQGDRPHRRGGVEAAHRDRLHADGARPDLAAHPPARDREAGAGEGERRGLGGAPRAPGARAGRARRAARLHGGALAAGEDHPRRRERAAAGEVLQGGGGRHDSSATATWPARRPSATASCPTSSGASSRPTRTWPSCRPARAS